MPINKKAGSEILSNPALRLSRFSKIRHDPVLLAYRVLLVRRDVIVELLLQLLFIGLAAGVVELLLHCLDRFVGGYLATHKAMHSLVVDTVELGRIDF